MRVRDVTHNDGNISICIGSIECKKQHAACNHPLFANDKGFDPSVRCVPPSSQMQPAEAELLYIKEVEKLDGFGQEIFAAKVLER